MSLSLHRVCNSFLKYKFRLHMKNVFRMSTESQFREEEQEPGLDDPIKPVMTAILDPEVEKLLNETQRPRSHPGRRKQLEFELPAFLELSAKRSISKFVNSDYREDVSRMAKRVYHLQLPEEPEDIAERRRRITAMVIAKETPVDFDSLNETEREFILTKRKQKIERIMAKSVPKWNEVVYDNEYACAVYLGARLAPNYFSLLNIFNEIKQNDPSFAPKTLFDFGSGPGTTMFAANRIWPASISEHMNIDVSKPMHEMGRLLLSGGIDGQPMMYNGVYFKEFLPVSSHVKYDLVVSAFTLMELPSRKARIQAIEALWQKTGDMLVVVETGTTPGFAIINEVRHLILEMSGYDVTKSYYSEDTNPVVYDPTNAPTAHIVAPCPHHLACPRLFTGGPVLCNFRANYSMFDVGQMHLRSNKEFYSYIVLRKGQELLSSTRSKWPRINQEVLMKSGFVICRACCPDGGQKQVILTKVKHKGWLYKVAKISEWGDLLPATIYESHVPLKFWDKLKRNMLPSKKAEDKDD